MITSAEEVQDRLNFGALYAKRSVSTQYTQQVIQPLQESYNEGQEIRIVLQKTKHFIPLAKIRLFYRFVIQYGADSALDSNASKASALRSFQCPTPHSNQSCFQMTSLTFNGNQVLAQTSITQNHSRSMFMRYFNSLKDIKEFKIDGDENISGVFHSAREGSSLNVQENQHTHSKTTGFLISNQTIALNSEFTDFSQTNYDYTVLPRAIVDRTFSYNLECNPNFSAGTAGYWVNKYWAGYQYTNGNVVPDSDSGYFPTVTQVGKIIQGSTAIQTAVTSGHPQFPFLTRMISPSIAQYHAVNSRLQNLRMRWITVITTPITTVQEGMENLAQDSYSSKWQLCQEMGGEAASATSGILAVTSTALGGVSPNQTTTVAQGKASVGQPEIFCMTYGTTVQGILGTGQCKLSADTTRQTYFVNNTPSAANSLYYPPEQFTNMSVSLGDLSIELQDISAVPSCMDSTQIVAILQLLPPSQCISAYLQPGLFAEGNQSTDGNNALLPATQQGTNVAIAGTTNLTLGGCSRGMGSVGCANFIAACLLGSTTYQVADVVCQIPYESCEQDNYALVRQFSYMAIPFRSIKIQTDLININGQVNQRVPISGASNIMAVICWFKPAFPVPNATQTFLAPQHTMVDYQNNFYVPSAGDLRCIADLDSIYLPYSSAQVILDGKTYSANPITPVQNSIYLNYLRSLNVCDQVFNGKAFGVGLRDFVTSRNYLIIPINPLGSRAELAQDSQLMVSISFDNSVREAYTRAMGLGNGYTQQCVYLHTHVITLQNLVAQDYVKL